MGNTPPRVSGRGFSYILIAGETRVVKQGTPFDMQLDEFWMEEWGVTSGDIPVWAVFVNETID